MKKTNIILICVLIAFVWLPIAYYFWIEKPSIEREKFEYQKKLDQERERMEAQEKIDKRAAEAERESNYTDCITQAENEYNNNFVTYCWLWYSDCKNQVDDWNRSLDWYPTLSHMRKTYAECDKFMYRDWQCTMYDKHKQEREQKYKDAISRCDKLYY